MDLNVTRAEYIPAAKKVRVEGTGGVNITVKALLNPVLHGESDEQVFNNYGSISALDKQEKSNAVTFQFDLATGNTPSPFNLVVVASHGKGFQNSVPPNIVPVVIQT